MALFNPPRPLPPPLNLKRWVPRKGKAMTHWLPDDEFDVQAKKHGVSTEKDGFAIWGRWWKGDEIFLRARWLRGFAHEARHVETQSNFHE